MMKGVELVNEIESELDQTMADEADPDGLLKDDAINRSVEGGHIACGRS